MKYVDNLQQRHHEWAKETFPDETVEAKFNHLREEIDELEDEPHKIGEFADAYLFISHLAAEHNHTMSNVVAAASVKFGECKEREWFKTEDGYYRHTKKDVSAKKTVRISKLRLVALEESLKLLQKEKDEAVRLLKLVSNTAKREPERKGAFVPNETMADLTLHLCLLSTDELLSTIK